jgi:hypothetical protein
MTHQLMLAGACLFLFAPATTTSAQQPPATAGQTPVAPVPAAPVASAGQPVAEPQVTVIGCV